jgi:hypothetical protein
MGMATSLHEMRLALRRLRHSPGFTAAALISFHVPRFVQAAHVTPGFFAMRVTSRMM